jgi:hypothetical protein
MDDLWAACELEYADGRSQRFGPDERDPGDVPHDLQHDSSMPGGWADGSAVLPRPPDLVADDAKLFSGGRFYGAEGTFYEGRIKATPQVGANEVRLELEGWSASLDDDETLQMPIVDRDLSRFANPPSVQRQLLLSPTYPHVGSQQVVTDDADLRPAVQLQQTHVDNVAGTRIYWTACLYKSLVPLESVYHDTTGFDLVNNVVLSGAWDIKAALGDDDTFQSADASGDLTGTAGYITATTDTRTCIEFQIIFDATQAALDGSWNAYLRDLAAYGRHGLTKQGAAPRGFLACDIIAYALRACPHLRYTVGDSIERGSYIVRHYWQVGEKLTARNVTEHMTALGGAHLYPNDWGVYEGREFFHRTPGSYGRTWRVRKDDVANLTATGPDASKRAGGMKVSYRDPAGTIRSVGPPGSGSDHETDLLLDADPGNPAHRLGRRWKHEQVGILGGNETQQRDAAVNIARFLLAEANRVDWRGDIEVEAEARDEAGNVHPARQMRAGDQVVVEDEEALWAPKPVATTSYSQDSLVARVSVGAPPYRGEVMLAQLAAATELTGAS